jgi:adenylate kinase family enzyme
MQAKRIVILGPSGAGKSTLARLIGERLDIPAVHLDRFYWTPGWVQIDRATFRERVDEAVKADAWVMDGNYTSASPLEVRLARAHAVIWLDLPRYIYFPSAVCRAIKSHGRVREDIGPGCAERFDVPFLKDWVWTYPTRARPQHAKIMATLPADVRGIVLTSRAEVTRFVNSLPQSLTRARPATGLSSPPLAARG